MDVRLSNIQKLKIGLFLRAKNCNGKRPKSVNKEIFICYQTNTV